MSLKISEITEGEVTTEDYIVTARGGNNYKVNLEGAIESVMKTYIPDTVGDGVADDRAAIQTALDAAEADGGGTVYLGPGTYKISTVNSPASGDKAAGAYGLEIPSNVTLAGSGEATVILGVEGGAYGVGVIISPKGMRTATTNFGAATNVTLKNFKIYAPSQNESAGNLINLVHASYWLIENVNMAGCYYHGLEIDQSKWITVRNCKFSGAYTGISGSWIQFDYGAAGPTNRPAGITTRVVEDVLFERCIGVERTAGESGSERDIELTHNNSEMELNRVTFRDCNFTGRNEQFVSIADIASSNPATITGASIEAATDLVTAVGHGLWNGARVNLSAITGGAGLVVAQDYYWIYVSSTTGKLASTRANALAGTAVDVTTNATGVTLVPYVGGSIKELLFERCTFVTKHPKAFAFFMVQQSGREFRGIRFRNCEFTGPSANFVIMGGSTSLTYNSTHSLRWEGEISNCRFLFDKTQMPISLDVNLVIAVAWSSFIFRDNYIECTGDFPVSVGSSYSRIAYFNNNLYTEVVNNRINWSGNATFAVNRLGILVDVALPDAAGTTRGFIVKGNQFYSSAGTGWSYGLFITRGTTAPASAGSEITANWCNAANSTQNNTIVTGTNAAGQVNGGALSFNVRSVSSATTITDQDAIINCDTTSGSITVTAANVLLRKSAILVKTVAANTLTCGSTSVTAVGAKILVYSDGTTTFTQSF